MKNRGIRMIDFKRYLSVVVTLVMCLGLIFSAMTVEAGAETGTGQGDVSISIDGIIQNIDPSLGAPFIDENNRTLVPLRGVFEAIGAEVSWNNSAREAVVQKDGKTAKIPVGYKFILVNEVRLENDSNAIIKDDRTYLPIRIVLESFGCKVDWDNDNRRVVVTTAKAENQQPVANEQNQGTGVNRNGDMRAIWVSYLDYDSWPKDEYGFKAAYDSMLAETKALGFNSVIFQVRPDCDATYPSKYYPWSKFVSGTQGKDPGYDPLKYMVDRTHEEGMEFHAWFNPFRVTGYKCGWSQVSDSNPAKVWLTDSDSANDRWVLLHEDMYYLNPSVPQVRDMIVDGVREVVENYKVDGIHFDDYFYPTVKDSDSKLCFDKAEYESSNPNVGIADWRRENVNKLIRSVYAAIKEVNPSVEFGVSPGGNLNNLRSNTKCFADVDTWLSQDGYMDYIMPQLYWGFDVIDSKGNKASYAYDTNLQSWIELAKKGNVKLMVGMSLQFAGDANAYKNSNGEWGNSLDMLLKMTNYAKNSGAVSGYAVFRYGLFHKSSATEAEINYLSSGF